MGRHSDHSFDCPSPYPPSSPSSDSSEDEMTLTLSSNSSFRSSLASVPESTLRAIMAKLADGNPRFQRAIIKELAYVNAADSSPMTSTNSKPRRSNRCRNRRNRKGLSVATESLPITHRKRPISLSSDSPLSPDDNVYHPGHLDEEVYEFLQRTPDEVTFNVVRTIAMWSCCDEDEWSPGCVLASSLPLPVGHQPDIVHFSHPDIFPDSDLELRHEGETTHRIPATGISES